MPPFDRGPDAYDDFQARAVAQEAPYIAVGDVSSFYFFVDHELLATRIVDATAHADTAEAVRTLLGALIGRPYGLPQNFAPSAPFSELFIGPVERRLIREGFPTFRVNDDFRICAPSWGEGLRAIETLQEEVSQVGLDLNGDKSRVLTRDTVQKHLGLLSDLLSKSLGGVEVDLRGLDPYTGEPAQSDTSPSEGNAETTVTVATTPSAEAVERAIAAAFVEAANARLEEPTSASGFVEAARRRFLSILITHLGRLQSDAAVELGARLLALDPLIAKQYSWYLGKLETGGPTTSKWISQALSYFDGHAPPWSEAWLMKALLDERVELTDDTVGWLESFRDGPAPDLLRVRAVLVLALHDRVTQAQIAAMQDTWGPTARVDAVAAMAFTSVRDPDLERAVIEDQPFGQEIFNEVHGKRARARSAV